MDLSDFGIINKKEFENKNKTNNSNFSSNQNLNINLNEIKKTIKNKKIERYLPWFLKYQIKNFDDLIITENIQKIINFIENKPKNKGLLLIGRAGSGKTTTLNLIGKKYNFEIFELNASDSRNKKSIINTIGDVINQKSLFNKKKLILIDEVDGISGSNDRGGIAEIIKYLKKNYSYPLVFTANDNESDKIKTLKKNCITIDFENNSVELLLQIAKKIFNLENVKYDLKELNEFISKRSTIDIRGFINDLQSSVINNTFKINENLEIRDYKKKINIILNKIYFSYPEDALKSTFNSNINLDDLFLYLEENSPQIFDNKSLIFALNQISKADIFRERIKKWQYWRFLLYINFYLTYGISSFHSNNLKKIKEFKKNNRILKKWIYNNKYNALKSRTKIEKSKNIEPKFIEKLAKIYGTSIKKCRKNDLFYFIIAYKNNIKFQNEMDKLLEIDQITKKILMQI